jgi:glycosyltransferase involved in cell wall biosynthesis
LLANQFNGDSPLLVLGDLPLLCRGPQTVFVQTSNLLKSSGFFFGTNDIKYRISRMLFQIGMDRVGAFIVQTDVMRDKLERSYPSLVGRVHVIAQPVPAWLLHSSLKRHARVHGSGKKLNLIYPAADYPHKNHQLLSRIDTNADWPVKHLTLTIDGVEQLAPALSWIEYRGFLSPQEMIDAYAQVDALLFLSKKESYGFPLLEAMFIGLPIVCPDLPYAHELCGDNALYFDPDEPESLRQALLTLQARLDHGWWPDWQERLVNIPKDWDSVAQKMLEVACRVTTKTVS